MSLWVQSYQQSTWRMNGSGNVTPASVQLLGALEGRILL